MKFYKKVCLGTGNYCLDFDADLSYGADIVVDLSLPNFGTYLVQDTTPPS